MSKCELLFAHMKVLPTVEKKFGENQNHEVSFSKFLFRRKKELQKSLFFFFKDENTKQIDEQLLEAYKDCSPSLATVHKWVAEFKNSHKSLEDDPHTGCPKIPEIIPKVHDMVLDD